MTSCSQKEQISPQMILATVRHIFFLMTLEIGEFQGQVYLPACFIFYNVFSKKEQIGSLTVLHGRRHIFSFIGKMRQSVGARALVHGNCNVCFYQFYPY